MNIPSLISKTQSVLDSKAAVALDWILAFGAIAYGAYSLYQGESGFITYAILVSGIAGLFLAYKRPSKVAEKLISEKITKKASAK